VGHTSVITPKRRISAIWHVAKDGDNLILLLGGGTKKNQQADIERAKLMWAEYKLRKHVAKTGRRR
jgi:hypothetical protein